MKTGATPTPDSHSEKPKRSQKIEEELLFLYKTPGIQESKIDEAERAPWKLILVVRVLKTVWYRTGRLATGAKQITRRGMYFVIPLVSLCSAFLVCCGNVQRCNTSCPVAASLAGLSHRREEGEPGKVSCTSLELGNFSGS